MDAFDYYVPTVELFCKKGFRRSFVEDAVMESIQAASISEVHNIKAYLYTTTFNKLRNRLRKEKKYREVIVSKEDSSNSLCWSILADDKSSPVDLLIREETLDRLMFLMDNLSPATKEVLKLYYLKGISLKEISEKLGKNYNTVKALNIHGIRTLKELIRRG